MARSVLLDAGPIVAFLHDGEEHHAWAVAQFRRFPQFATCEPVLAEACARLAYYGKDPARVLELARDGDWDIRFAAKPNADRIVQLMRKYRDQPMDFADACLVVMSERLADCLVLTLDERDFSVYRRHDRKSIPVLSPSGAGGEAATIHD